jgi:serine/threonine protein kinase
MEQEQTQQKLGKYTLVRHLATGGMAEIWLAEQEGPGGFNKQLVIKRILQHLARDGQFTQMFLDEARLVAQLTHPNIGQIYELGEIEGSYFLAMEYIEGIDLSVVVELCHARGTHVPIELAVYAVSQMLLALEYAHNYVDREGNFVGLVHRDVTPHNVLVSNDGVIKLVDFGVAKAAANQAKTQTGAVKGKFAYMAPEQINNKPLDRRVDVFASGVVLYEVLTGAKPFGDDLFAVNAILNNPTPDPRAVREDIPQSLVNILELALGKDIEHRYQSAQAMMEDLEDFLRASNKYVGQRDLAAFVRDLQGLELTGSFALPEMHQSGPRARITEKEDAVDHAAKHTSDSGRFVSTGPQTNPAARPHEHPQTGANTQIKAATEGQVSSTGGHATVTIGEKQGGGTNVGLIAAFGFVIVAILVAGIALFALAVSGGDDKDKKDPKAKVVKTEKKDPKVKDNKPTEKANPKAFMHEGGYLVFINTPKKARVYYEGTYIGDTQLQTTLKPGEYTLIFEVDGKKFARKIDVAEKDLQSIKVKFD